MGLALITAPTIEPVSYTEAKQHLRIETDDEIDIIQALARAAREFSENQTGRQFCTATWEMGIDHFEAEIELPKPPLQSVTSIKYLDEDGVEKTLSSTVYDVDITTAPGVVRLAYNQVWPIHRWTTNAIKIRFVAGYGAPAAVPETLKAAIKLYMGHLFENREAINIGNIVTPIPLAFEALINAYRIVYLV